VAGAGAVGIRARRYLFLFAGGVSGVAVIAGSEFWVYSDGITASAGGTGAAHSMAHICWNGFLVPGELDDFGDGIFFSGVAGSVFCESASDAGSELEAGGDGADAGGVV